MALVQSSLIQLGTLMPEFRLKNAWGRTFESKSFMGLKGLLIAFTCNHCPYAIAVWPRLIEISKLAKSIGVETVAINPNINPDYPDDSPEQMKIKINEWNIPFEYLVDESQDVAQKFDARCTPDIYLFDSRFQLVYHGRIDDNWKDEHKVTCYELRDAVQQLANDLPISQDQKPSMGCSIKWNDSDQ